MGDAEPVQIHKTILIKVPFFEKCLQAGFEEALTNIIRMPEDKPEIFDDMIGFLYFGDLSLEKYRLSLLDNKHDADSNKWKMLHRLEELYQLAEKLDYEELHNKIMDILLDISYQFSPRSLDRMHQRCSIDSSWIKFGIARFAYDFTKYGLAGMSKHAGSMKESEVLDWFAGGGDLVREVMQWLGTVHDWRWRSPREGSRCKWHVHRRTPECGNAA